MIPVEENAAPRTYPEVPAPMVFARRPLRRRLEFVLILIPLPLAFVLLVLLPAFDGGPDTTVKFLRALSASGIGFWINVLPALAAIAAVFAHVCYGARARIVIDAAGIAQEFDGPAWAGLVGLRVWRIAWKDVQQVVHTPTLRSIHIVPSRATGSAVSIATDAWIRTGTGGIMPVVSQRKPCEPDLVAALRELRVFDLYRGRRPSRGFDLQSNPVTRVVTWIALGLIIYGIADLFLQTESWASGDWDYAIPHVIAAAAGAVVFGFVLAAFARSGRIPPAVTFGLALFCGGALGFASFVGGIRVNQIWGGPLVVHEYRFSADCNALEAQEPNLPEIEYRYSGWQILCRNAARKTVGVYVRQGLFGYYQYNTKEHAATMRNIQK